MALSTDAVRNEIAPILEQILTDEELGNEFVTNGVDALDKSGIELSDNAREFFQDVDRTAAEEAIQAFRNAANRDDNVYAAAGTRAAVVAFPVVALVLKGVHKPGV